MARVVWSVQARKDVGVIIGYIQQFDPPAAARMGSRLRALGDSLAVFPERGRLAPGGARELPTVRPYVLRYRVVGEDVLIVRVRHGRRLSPEHA